MPSDPRLGPARGTGHYPPRPAPRPIPPPAVLRARAERALRARRAPTVPIGVRGDEEGPSDQQAREVIDLALRVGEILLATGASASDVTSTVLRLTRAYGVRSLHVDVTYSSIALSNHRGPFRDPVTVMRIVPSMAADFTRLQAIQSLVRQIVEADEPVEISAAREAVDEIVARHHPYRRSLVTVALAILGGAVGALLGGGWALIVLAAASAAVVDRVQRALSLAGIPAFFSHAVGAAIPTILAGLVWQWSARTGYELSATLAPSVIVATGVVVLLAGLSVVSAAQDTLDGYYVTAAGRTFEVMVLSSGVAVGVLGVLAVTARLEVPIAITAKPVELSGNLAIEVTAAIAVAGANAVASYTGPRAVLFAAGVGGLGWAIFRAGTAVDLSVVTSTGLAALVVGAVAQVVAVRFRVPALAVTTGGIVPLLPGLAVFRGILDLVQQGPGGDGSGSLLSAAAVGMAIAGGVSLGSLPVRRAHADRIQRRLLARSAGDSRD